MLPQACPSYACTYVLLSLDCCHSNYNTGKLSDLELNAVDVLGTALQWSRQTMVVDNKATEPLVELLQLSESLQGIETIETAIKVARRQTWFAKL